MVLDYRVKYVIRFIKMTLLYKYYYKCYNNIII